jgi:hypothetical protein
MFTSEINALLEKAGCKGFYPHKRYLYDDDDYTQYIYCLVDDDLDYDTIYYPLSDALSEYCRRNYFSVNGKQVFAIQLIENEQIDLTKDRYTWRSLEEILDKPSDTLTIKERLTRLEQHLGYY